ncbi:MAG: hypothetical protein ACK46O_00275, partial [Flavobacteriia bacterium]
GHISDEIKDGSFENHNGINRFGGDASAEFEYRNCKADLFGKENFGFTLKAGYYNYLSVLYSKDLFGLAFYGNERYLGQQVDFSGSRFTAIFFQKVGFGLIDKRSGSSLSLNYYSISNFAEAQLRDGLLYQNSDADSVTLVADGFFDQATNSGYFKGHGFGLDADIRFPVSFRNDKTSYIQILMKNAGVAFFSEPVRRFSANTTFNYTGFTFEQIYGDNAVIDDINVLDTLGFDSLTVKKYRILPGFIQVGKIIDEMDTSRFQGYYGVRMYTTLSYAPMVYAGVHLKATENWGFGLNAGYGGYTQFRLGLYAQAKIKEFSFGLASEDLIGIISKNGRGASFVGRLSYRL